MFEEHKKSMELCHACPSLCQSACPVFVNDGNKSHAPWGLMQVLNGVRKKELVFSPEIAAISYQCLTCKGCTVQCEHGIEIPPILQEARNQAVEMEIAPEAIKDYLAKFHGHNNPFAKDLLKKLHDTLPKRYFKNTAKVAYFASCTTLHRCPEVIQDTFSLFEKLKIDFVTPYADPVQCCGYPLISSGAEYEFVDLAEINYHSLKKYKYIITGSPACAYTLKVTYAKYDFNIASQVLTINQFLSPYLKNINFKLKKNIRSKFMYHDPCYLARYLGEKELPREMIADVTGFPPTEFYDNRERCSCSGQGGTYAVIEKENAQNIIHRRLEECAEKKMNMILTQCPSCIHTMRENSNNLIVRDVISYLNDCIEGTKT